MERFTALHGKRLDHDERVRKRTAREGHDLSEKAQNLRGLRAKLHQKKRHSEKIQMKKAIKAQEEKDVKGAAPSEPSSTPLPNYLLDRSESNQAKALSSAIKNRRKEQVAKFAVPLPKVKGISEEEMFKVSVLEKSAPLLPESLIFPSATTGISFETDKPLGGQDRQEDSKEGLEEDDNPANGECFLKSVNFHS